MPKVKTRKTVKKRFKLTAKGHVKRKKAYTRHLLTKSKSSKQKRRLRGTALVHPNQERVVKQMLGA